MKSCSSRCSSASSPQGHRATISAGSDPDDRSLWPTLQDPAPAEPPKLYLPLLVSTDKKGRETLELSRDCAVLESRRERKRTEEIYNASCWSGKVYLGPTRKPHLPQGQDSCSTGPNGGPGPHYSQTSVPGAELLATGRKNALRQGRRRKLPQLWGLLTWKLNRAAEAQRY